MKTQTSTKSYVFANDTCSTATSAGLIIHLRRGQVWDASDVLVKERPWHFIDEPAEDMLIRTTSDTLAASQRATMENWPNALLELGVTYEELERYERRLTLALTAAG